jgi:ankyrin repeat protein
LITAVQANSVALVQLLLEHGADINATNAEGQNVMFTAAQTGSVSMMEYLMMQHGYSVTAVDTEDRSTLLAATVQWGRHKVAAEWLIQQGVNVNAMNCIGFTALHNASMRGCDDAAMFELLLANGADVNKYHVHGITALDMAAGKGNVECAKVLIAAGIDVNHPQLRDRTSLHIAVTKQYARVVELLLQHGATAVMDRVIASRCEYGVQCCSSQTALMMGTDVDTVKLLLAAGADVHVVNDAGDTCLHAAVRHKPTAPVLCLLIKAGAKLHAVNHKGKTAAQIAHVGNDLIEQLLNRARTLAVSTSSITMTSASQYQQQ